MYPGQSLRRFRTDVITRAAGRLASKAGAEVARARAIRVGVPMVEADAARVRGARGGQGPDRRRVCGVITVGVSAVTRGRLKVVPDVRARSLGELGAVGRR